ncbi:MAG: hypothetical protein WCA35_23840 [Kovacikia sp.]
MNRYKSKAIAYAVAYPAQEEQRQQMFQAAWVALLVFSVLTPFLLKF